MSKGDRNGDLTVNSVFTATSVCQKRKYSNYLTLECTVLFKNKYNTKECHGVNDMESEFMATLATDNATRSLAWHDAVSLT